MKVLHILSQHPESTGSGVYIRNIISNAALKGYRNFLVAGISGGVQPVLEGIGEDCCRYVTFGSDRLPFAIPGMSDIMPYPSSRFSDLRESDIEAYEAVFSETITKAVEDFRPDIIHTHHLWLVTALTRKLFPALRIVTSCHSTDLRQYQQCPHLQKRVEPYCKTLDRVLALSRDQRDTIEQLYGIGEEKIDIVGGGFNGDLFYPTPRTTAPPIHILYAGKFSHAKGLDLMLESYRDLSDSQLHLHLAGSGTGSQAKQCLDLARQCGQRLTLHGRLSQDTLAQLMRKCHLFLLPSFYEGLPLVLLEALNCGCRIITTDLPGCRELLETADSDLVEFIALPEFTTEIDRPRKRDWPLFKQQLEAAVTKMKRKVLASPTPRPDSVESVTSSYRWECVFEKIAAAYLK